MNRQKFSGGVRTAARCVLYLCKPARFTLLMLLAVMSATGAWAQEQLLTTFNWPSNPKIENNASLDGVTIKSDGSFDNDYLALNANGGYVTLESNTNIAKVVFTFETSNPDRYGGTNATVTSGGEYSLDGQKGTWVGLATKVTFATGESDGKKARITKIEVYTSTTTPSGVTYDMNGKGTNETIADATNYTAAEILSKTPTYAGYKFDGWYTDKECKDGNEAKVENFKTPITLYAKWIKTYTVTYDMQGKGTNETQSDVTELTPEVLSKIPTADGYKFDGWYTDTDFKQKATEGTTLTADITLYAKWTEYVDPNAVRRVVVFPRSRVSNFGGYTGNTNSISKTNDNVDATDNDDVTTAEGDAVLTLSTSDTKVQAQGFPNGEAAKPGKGFKVAYGGSFKITAATGYKIKLIALMTGETNRHLTASPDVEAVSAEKDSIYRYSFAGEQEVTFTNNNSNSIHVYVINVTYEYTAQEGKTPLLIEFEGNRILNGYVDDTGVTLPKHTVKKNDGTVVTEGYTLEYVSNNSKIVKVPEPTVNSLNLLTAGTAAVTVVIKPGIDTDYEGGSGVVTVVSRPLPELTVNAANVIMNSNLIQQKKPSINVWLNGTELKSNEYKLTYKLSPDYAQNVVEITPVTDGDDIFKVLGSSYNWTTGQAKLTVTATPTEDYKAKHKCQAGSVDFTFTVKPAGEKRVPTIDVPTEVTFATGQTKKIEPRIVYDGSDITSRFDITNCKVTDIGSSSSASAKLITNEKRKYCEIYTGTSATSGTGKAPFVVTITAKPKQNYTDQYINPVTQTISVNVEDVNTYKQLTIDDIADQYGKVGEEHNMPVLSVRSGGNVISLEDMNVEVTSTAAQVVVRNLGRNNFSLLCAGMDTVTVRVCVSSKADIAEKYEDAITRFRVIVTDDKVYKVADGQTLPQKGETVTTVPGVTMTYGGWVFGAVRSIFGNSNDENPLMFGVTTKGWVDTKYTDDAGSSNRFTYLISGSKHEDAKDERGANCAPEGTTVDYADKETGFKMIDKMFSVPAEGAYFSFAPKVNGRVTAHVLQNGVFNSDGDKGSTKYSKNRRVFVVDEGGNRIPDGDIDAFIDVTTGKMPKDASNNPITTISKYGLTTSWQPSQDFHLLVPDADDTKIYKFIYDKDGNVTNFVNNLYRRQVNKENDHVDGGYIVLVKAPVTYSFNVKAGKTYYLYSFGSKLSLYSFEFAPADDASEEKTLLELSENAADNTTKIADQKGKTVQVSLDRKFKAGIWNSCVLPFSLNKQQVDAIFGSTRDKNNPNGTEILYFDKVEGSTIYFVRHAYNTIVAGKPFLINPTAVDAQICPEKMGDYKYVTIENDAQNTYFGKLSRTDIRDYWPKGTTSDVQQQVTPVENAWYWQASYDKFNISKGSYIIRDYIVGGPTADGKIVRYPLDAPLTIKAFRGYLRASDTDAGANAKPMTVAFSDFESGETTYIDNVEIDEEGTLCEGVSGKVYNLQGQVVRNDASMLDTLPKGIYIVNGKKVSVK